MKSPIYGPRQTGEWIVLAAVLVPLVALKLYFNPSPIGDLKRDDGAFYYQIARHVAEGDGLQTSVSLYHWGLRHLPHASFSYPLWTLTLGIAGRFIGLDRAAHLLPEVLYVITLLLMYAVVRRLAAFWNQRDEIALGTLRINAGHWAVVLFGLNPNFFEFTSLPFGEGLAFALAFGSLLLVPCSTTVGRPGLRGAALGLTSGLAYLARSQFLGLPIALAAALALQGVREATYRRAAMVCLLVSSVIIAGWSIYVYRAVELFAPMQLIDHTRARETPELPPDLWLVEKPSILETVIDRLMGFKVAFTRRSPVSYIPSFDYAAYLIPLAVLILPLSWRAASSTRDPAFVPAAAVLLCGLASLAPVHNLHSFRGEGWFFNFRHGLPLIFPLIVAIPYLMSRHVVMRVVVVAVLLWSARANGRDIRRIVTTEHPAPTVSQQALAAWIDQQPRPPMFLSTIAAPLGAITRATYHWIRCDDPGSQTRKYFELFEIDYLVTTSRDRQCRFFTEVRNSFDEVRSFGEDGTSLTLWRFRR
jgi:hypothetical protein